MKMGTKTALVVGTTAVALTLATPKADAAFLKAFFNNPKHSIFMQDTPKPSIILPLTISRSGDDFSIVNGPDPNGNISPLQSMDIPKDDWLKITGRDNTEQTGDGDIIGAWRVNGRNVIVAGKAGVLASKITSGGWIAVDSKSTTPNEIKSAMVLPSQVKGSSAELLVTYANGSQATFVLFEGDRDSNPALNQSR